MLVVSGIIQEYTYGLSVYHAFLVVGLSFMATFSAMPAYYSLGANVQSQMSCY